jgi:hypothetical protein
MPALSARHSATHSFAVFCDDAAPAWDGAGAGAAALGTYIAECLVDRWICPFVDEVISADLDNRRNDIHLGSWNPNIPKLWREKIFQFDLVNAGRDESSCYRDLLGQSAPIGTAIPGEQ